MGAKALNDPIQGINAMSRAGVSFTKQQKEQIKTLVESGRTLEAQKMILAELETEYGGAAEAAGNTFQGALNKLKNAAGNLGEALGGGLLPPLTWIVDKMAIGIDTATELGGMIGTIATLLWQNLNPAAKEEAELQDRVNTVIAENTYSDARDHIVEYNEGLKANKTAADEAATANKNVAISIIEMSQAAFANDAIQTLNKAYQDGKIDEDAYRKEMAELMIVWLKMPGETTDAMITLRTLKQQLNDGTIDAIEYANSVETLYLKYKQLDGTTAVTTIVTRYEEEGRKGYVDPGTGAKYQSGTGGWRVVKPGYPNDSFRIGLSSGEMYNVIPNQDNRQNPISFSCSANRSYRLKAFIIANDWTGFTTRPAS